MSCYGYKAHGKTIYFGEDQASQETVGCLCTFPVDASESLRLTVDRVRSLAMLGAAVVLAESLGVGVGDRVYIPGDLPGWLVDELDRLLPVYQAASTTP